MRRREKIRYFLGCAFFRAIFYFLEWWWVEAQWRQVTLLSECVDLLSFLFYNPVAVHVQPCIF